MSRVPFTELSEDTHTAALNMHSSPKFKIPKLRKNRTITGKLNESQSQSQSQSQSNLFTELTSIIQISIPNERVRSRALDIISALEQKNFFFDNLNGGLSDQYLRSNDEIENELPGQYEDTNEDKENQTPAYAIYESSRSKKRVSEPKKSRKRNKKLVTAPDVSAAEAESTSKAVVQIILNESGIHFINQSGRDSFDSNESLCTVPMVSIYVSVF